MTDPKVGIDGSTFAPSRLRITGHTRVVGVIGHPVRHSLSPAIHNAGFRSSGSDHVYVAFDVPEGSATSALEAVRILDLAGLSVTMPHKAVIARSVDSLVESARRLDSVNTVEVSESGELIGHSTDGDGLIASMLANDVSVNAKSVVVFGAGGAGRSVVDALARHGAERILVVNRSFDAAERAADLGRGRAEARSLVDTSMREDIARCDIVINASSVGMRGVSEGRTPFDVDLLPKASVVVDLVYHPLRTALLERAHARGCRTLDGLGMLVHQAALQQVIWTGLQPDVKEMTEAAVQALQ